MPEFIRYYIPNIFVDKKANCEIKDAFISALGATANQLLVAGIPGKKLVILSGCVSSSGIVTAITFKSDSGANAVIKRAYWTPLNTGGGQLGGVTEMYFNPTGIFRCDAGKGLFIDNSAAVLAQVAVSYIEVNV